MRGFVLIFMAVCAAGAGCGSSGYYWHNPLKTRTQTKRDCQECRHLAATEASEAVAEYYYRNSPAARGLNGPADGIDAGASDYSTVRGWSTWGTTYQENVFRGCMKHRGYRLISVAGRQAD